MSLTLAYNIARGALAANATTASVVSRNIANAENASASRKTTLVTTDATGGVYVAGIANQVRSALFEQAIERTSASSYSSEVLAALEGLSSVVGDPELEGSPAALIGDFRSALQTAAAAPYDATALQRVLTSAEQLANSLNSAANVVTSTRQSAQDGIASSVNDLQSLLDSFSEVNSEIVTGTALGRDVTDELDRRNALLSQISSLVDIKTQGRSDNDMAIFLANGTVLFETSARSISFDAGAALLPGQTGAALIVDGVPQTDGKELGGKIGGLVVARDEITLELGAQLDEIARGLIVATSESDQSALPTGAEQAGLFTWSGGPGLPASGAVTAGLASMITVNANADPSRGGDLERIRDGGISDPGDTRYVYNSEAVAGYTDRLNELIGNLSESQPFASSIAISVTTGGVLALATTSAGWLEGERSAASGADEKNQVLATKAISAWQSEVGVNLDDELASLMTLERSYQASSRLISAVNSMFDALLSAVG